MIKYDYAKLSNTEQITMNLNIEDRNVFIPCQITCYTLGLLSPSWKLESGTSFFPNFTNTYTYFVC